MGIEAFVAHLEKSNYIGIFDKVRELVIKNSRYFIFINSKDSTSRSEIIKEFKMAYPNGYSKQPELIVFYHNKHRNKRKSLEFNKQIGFDVSAYNQQDFTDKYELSSVARELFDSLRGKSSDSTGSTESRTKGKKEPAHGNLFPKQNEFFVGRNREISKLRSLLGSHNSAIVTGLGGVGKGTLIYRFINSLKFEHIISIYMTSKTGIKHIIDIFNREFGTEYDSLDELHRYLNTQKSVLVFVDNYEIISNHIFSNRPSISQDVIHLHNFFASIPNNKIKLIISSRNRLNDLNIPTLELEGLSKEDGTDLFLSLIENNSWRIKSVPRNRVEEIVSELEGHPLAIKLLSNSYLGGGKSELESIYSELIRLKNKLTLNLKDRSLKASFDYSFNKLSKSNKELLLQMKTLISPFSEDLFSNVFSRKEKSLSILGISHFIKEYPLDMNTNEKRIMYDFHSLIRSYLNEKSSKMFPEVAEHISEYYQRFLKKVIDRLEIGVYYVDLKIIKEIVSKTPDDISVSIERINDPKRKSEVYDIYAIILFKIRHINKSFEIRNICIKLDTDSENYPYLADDYRELSNNYQVIKNWNLALLYAENALNQYLNLDQSNNNIPVMHLNLAQIHLKLKNIEKAEEYMKLVKYSDLYKNDYKMQSGLFTLEGQLSIKRGDYLQAVDQFTKAKNLDLKINKPELVINDLTNIAFCHKKIGTTCLAERLYVEALVCSEEIDDPVLALRCYYGLTSISGENQQKYETDVKNTIKEIQRRGLVFTYMDLII